MQLTRLSHVCLSTGDLQRTAAFYCTVLGCKIIHEYKNAQGEVYGLFLLVNNSTFLEFFRADSIGDVPSRFRHFCFEVANIDEWAQRFAQKGFPIEVRRGQTDGVLQFWISDPDGNKVEFHQYNADCPQYAFLSKKGRRIKKKGNGAHPTDRNTGTQM